MWGTPQRSRRISTSSSSPATLSRPGRGRAAVRSCRAPSPSPLAAAGEEHLPHSPFLNDLKENAETLYFATDEIMEDVNNLLSLELAAADHDTNEVMRVLTVFSAFFLPLTFIVGVYGMNFDVMPELRWTWGYPVVLTLMFTVCLGIYLWFRRKGWL